MNEPEPKLSATVLIIRDGADVPEVLMVQRHHEIDMAGGALVFPGGKIHREDSSPDWDAFTDGDFGPVQQDARIAAVRETFEEAGLLLARPVSSRGAGQPLVGPHIAEKLEPFRSAVDRGEHSFLELIREHQLVLALDSLIHFGHWITPTIMPKRYDTHFYLAPAPPDQIATHDGWETTDSVWIRAQDALDSEASGKAMIVFPTRMNLNRLREIGSVQAAITRFSEAVVITVQPQRSKTEEGEPCLIIPDVPGYGQTIELLSRFKRLPVPKE